MTTDTLIERSGPLKHDVLEFAKSPRFGRALTRELRNRFGRVVCAEHGELENFFDWFIQQYRRPDGRTVVDCYLPTRPDLPAPERDFLLGWRDVVEGIFEVTGHDGDALLTVNLLDDLEYRMVANVGPSVFEQIPAGSFLGTRVVPLGTDWLLSGASTTFPADHHETVLSVAAQMASRHPESVFRNPEKLARGWELQAADRAAFVEHFGGDTVVLGSADRRVAEPDPVPAARRARRVHGGRGVPQAHRQTGVPLVDRRGGPAAGAQAGLVCATPAAEDRRPQRPAGEPPEPRLDTAVAVIGVAEPPLTVTTSYGRGLGLWRWIRS